MTALLPIHPSRKARPASGSCRQSFATGGAFASLGSSKRASW
jgi:hypothetical protein